MNLRGDNRNEENNYRQQGIAKSGAEVLNSTFVLFTNICARLKDSAFKTPPSAIPETLCAIAKKIRLEILNFNSSKI